MYHCIQCDKPEEDCSCNSSEDSVKWEYFRCVQCRATWQNIVMGKVVNFLVAIRVSDEYLSEYEGLSPEDIGYYFIDQMQSDYEGAGIEFELLEVY